MASWPTDPDVRTVYLGAFTHEHADAIAGRLEEAGITWWHKQPGYFSRIWEFGQFRLYVDREKLEEARRLANEVLGKSDGSD